MAIAAPAHRDAEDAPPRFTYAYREYAEAPYLHKEVARYAIEGFHAAQIIKKDDLFKQGTREQKLEQCRKILTHEPVREHILEQVSLRAAESRYLDHELHKAMSRGRAKSVEKLVERVESGELTLREALAAAVFFTDRHPDGEFVRKSHTKVDKTVSHVVGSEMLAKLKENAALARISCAGDAHLIEVSASPSVAVEGGADD